MAWIASPSSVMRPASHGATGSEVRVGGRWGKVGRPHGAVACFSFHPRKVVTTGDGGMLTTRDADLDRKFRLLRQHAMSVPDTVRHGAGSVIFEGYPEVGFNYRLTDVQAAVGSVQLRRLPEFLARRVELAGRYTRAVACDGHHVPFRFPSERQKCFHFCRNQKLIVEYRPKQGFDAESVPSDQERVSSGIVNR